MKICIICSLSKEKECKKVEEFLKEKGFEVVTPFNLELGKNLYLIQRHYLEALESSDFVLVIPKYMDYHTEPGDDKWTDHSEFGLIIGESVSYEIAYARKIGKPVLFSLLPFMVEGGCDNVY